MTEQWRPIPGHEVYEASDLGRIRRVGRRLIAPALGCRGKRYLRFTISHDGVKLNMAVHRAVALAFLGPIPDGQHVAHMDGNSTNNRLSNLMYATPVENEAHKIAHGTRPIGLGHYRTKLTPDQVAEIRSNYRCRDPQRSAAAYARKFGVSKTTVQHLLKRRSWDLAGDPDYVGTPSGKRYGQKLSDADVVAIAASTERLTVLAERYGVSVSHVSGIRNGRTKARKSLSEENAARRERRGVWR